jgi:hypothetical protein
VPYTTTLMILLVFEIFRVVTYATKHSIANKYFVGAPQDSRVKS